MVASDMTAPVGRLRITAPTSFGRMHIAPWLAQFMETHRDLQIELHLDDSYIDLLSERVDVAIRICDRVAFGLSGQRLAANKRLLCASPDYIAEHGAPTSVVDLTQHNLIAADDQLPWQLEGPVGLETVSGTSLVKTNSSEVVRELALAGAGIALRSTWDVAEALLSGALVRVLPDHAGSSDTAIYAIYPQTHFVPTRVQRFIQFLRDLYSSKPYWETLVADRHRKSQAVSDDI